jgi:hypothetical protein
MLGATSRVDWLAANSISRDKPWLAEGVSRATWYRRRKNRQVEYGPVPVLAHGEAEGLPQGEIAASIGTQLQVSAPGSLPEGDGLDITTVGSPEADRHVTASVPGDSAAEGGSISKAAISALCRRRNQRVTYIQMRTMVRISRRRRGVDGAHREGRSGTIRPITPVSKKSCHTCTSGPACTIGACK